MIKFSQIKFCIGPMSINIINAVIKFCNENNKNIILIPSRRQIEYNGGYVNNWKTKDFCKYIKQNTKLIFLERDHGGPGQGLYDDDGYKSLEEDCKFFDIIHVDPWKKYPNYTDGFNKTLEIIKFCYDKNPNLYFEVGTEEAIRYFSIKDLENLMNDLKDNLKSEIFEKIVYLVIQSGTALKEGINIGKYDDNRLKKMVGLNNKFHILTKEHNGDWITDDEIVDKFNKGLDALNIAPEFGMIETKVVLSEIEKHNRKDLYNKFYDICLKSKRWEKWVDKDFKPEKNKRILIEICGHYVFSTKVFSEIKKELDVKKKIEHAIISHLKHLYSLI